MSLADPNVIPGIDLNDRSKRYVAACVDVDNWILGTIDGEAAVDGSITVLDVDPRPGENAQYHVEKGKWVHFPSPPTYPRLVGEQLLSLWRSEDTEWGTAFYRAELKTLLTRETDGLLTQMQLKFEDDTVDSRNVPIEFVFRPPKKKPHKEHKSKSKSKHRSSSSAEKLAASTSQQHLSDAGLEHEGEAANESRKRKEISPTKSEKEAKRSKEKHKKKKAKHESPGRTPPDDAPPIAPIDVDKEVQDIKQQAEEQGVMMDDENVPISGSQTCSVYSSARGQNRRWVACRWITEPARDLDHKPPALLATPYVVLF